MLTCRMVLKSTGEESGAFNELKNYYKEASKIYDANEDVSIDPNKNYTQEDIENVQYMSEKMYYTMYSDSFINWFGFDFRNENLTDEQRSQLNEQGEPKIKYRSEFGIDVAFIENSQGQKFDLPRTGDFIELPSDVRDEISNQITYMIGQLDGQIDRSNIGMFVDTFIEQTKDNTENGKYPGQEELIKIGLQYLGAYKPEFVNTITEKLIALGYEFADRPMVNEEMLDEFENIGNTEDSLGIKENTRVNSKDKASSAVRSFLNTAIPKIHPNGVSVVQGRFFPFTTIYEDFNRVWQILEPELANMPSTYKQDVDGEPVFEDMATKIFDKIEGLQDRHPLMSNLVTKLRKLNDEKKGKTGFFTQFYKAFHKQRNNYLTTQAQFKTVTNEAGEKLRQPTIKTIENNQDRISQPIFETWLEFISNNYINENTGKYEIPGFKEKLDSIIKEEDVDAQVEAIRALIKSTLGMTVDVDDIRLLGSNEKTGQLLVINFLDAIQKNFNNKPAFANDNLQNIFSQNLNQFEPFAMTIAKRRGTDSENTTLGPEGQYWNYSNMSFMLNVINSAQEGDVSYLDSLLNNNWSKASYLADAIKNNEITLLTDLQFKLQIGAKGESVTSANEHDQAAIQINRAVGKRIFNMNAPADKSTTYLLKGFEGINGVNKAEWLQRFREYAQAEYELAKQNPNHRHSMFMVNGKSLLEDMFREDGSINSEKFEPAIEEYIQSKVTEIAEKYNLTNPDHAISFFDSAVYNENGGNVDQILTDYVVNNLIVNMEMSMVFTGHPSYYKNDIDYTKRVPATQTDGVEMSLTEGDPVYYNVVVVDSIEEGIVSNISSEENIENVYNELKDLGYKKSDIESILGDYRKNNIADAQAWITPERAEFIAKKTGNWSDTHAAIYQKLKEGKKLTYDELQLVSAQPLKGVHFELIDGVPHYLKYSQAVLIPQLVKGTGLEVLLDKMREDNIDEVVTKDGFKSNNTKQSRIHNVNEDGTASISIRDDFKDMSMQLSNRYWKLQQPLPQKGIKMKEVASQIQKNIFADLVEFATGDNADKTLFNFRGNELTAREMIDEVVNSTVDILNEQKRRLTRALDLKLDEFGQVDMLSDKTLEKLRDVIDNQLAGGETENVMNVIRQGITVGSNGSNLDNIPTVKRKVQNAINAYFKSKLMKLSSNWGSMIQVSNFGSLKLSNDQKTNITFFKDLADLEGPKVDADGNVTKGQVLMPSWIIEKHIPNWQELSPEELKAKIPEELLSVVGYRIPNQGLSSNDALEVVGILPAEAGDSVVVYNGLTTKTGSDFDIDKMYMMLPNIQVRNNFNDLAEKYNITDKVARHILAQEFILTDIDNPMRVLKETMIDYHKKGLSFKYPKFDNIFKEFKTDVLEYATEGLAGMQNKLLEGYTSILTSPANYVNMVKSIDRSTKYIKNELIAYDAPPIDIFSPFGQIEKRSGLLKARTGIGAVANQLVNHALTQIASLDGFRAGDLLQDAVYDGDGKKVTEMLSGFLNAFVDVAKDDYVLQGNVTTDTVSSLAYLLRNGTPLSAIINFLKSPELKKALAQDKFNGSKFVPYVEIEEQKLRKKDIYAEYAKLISGGTVRPRFIPAVFNELRSDAKNVTKLIQASQYEVNGAGNTLPKVMSNIARVYDLIIGRDNTSYTNLNAYLNTENVLGVRFMNAVVAPYEIQKRMFMEGNMLDVIYNIADNVHPDGLGNHDVAESVSNFIYSKVFDKFYEGANKDYLFSLDFKKALLEMKAKYPKNLLLQQMISTVKLVNNKKEAFFTINSIRKKPLSEKNQLTQDFKSLLINEPKFAQLLIAKEFYQTGFQQAMGSYLEYIPSEYFQKFNDRIEASKEVVKNMNVGDLALEYAANNPKDIKTIPQTHELEEPIEGVPVVRKQTVNGNTTFYVPTEQNESGSAWFYTPVKNLKEAHRNKFGDPVPESTWRPTRSSNNIYNRVLDFMHPGREQKLLEKQQEELAETQQNLENLISDTLDLVYDSDLSTEEKDNYYNLIESAETEEEIGKIIKEICK